jgi:hypothetical protein
LNADFSRVRLAERKRRRRLCSSRDIRAGDEAKKMRAAGVSARSLAKGR